MSHNLWNINKTAFHAIVEKEIRRFLRIWVQTITPPSINAVLYLLIFGTLIGSRIGPIDGQPYLTYLVPGIVLMGVIVNSFSNVASSFFSAKFQSHIEELLIAPVHPLVIIFGYITGGIFRGFLVGSLVLIAAGLFGALTLVHPVITFCVFFLTSSLFAGLGFINAMLARSYDDISIVPNFILTPLIYVGGVFYSVDLLPEIWQSVSMINPLLYMISGFRYAMIGVSDVSIETAIVILIGANIVVISGAYWLFQRGTGIKA